uniref:Uncharacterized protein n=1 Tax=Skeletonema marinoi TaxID=267567 RepID=A0A7S2LWI9_9STRA|mmetsp:Transcript_30989/g.52538  ORF Transcript_30989/g.52538 Transcript_30989/m.52538 type:complete len:115 (+) Transcript_30989:292-636(+)
MQQIGTAYNGEYWRGRERRSYLRDEVIISTLQPIKPSKQYTKSLILKVGLRRSSHLHHCYYLKSLSQLTIRSRFQFNRVAQDQLGSLCGLSSSCTNAFISIFLAHLLGFYYLPL